MNTPTPPNQSIEQIPSKTTQNSTNEEDDLVDVELSEVNDILLDAVAHERIQNFKQIIRSNIKLVNKFNTLNTKVS